MNRGIYNLNGDHLLGEKRKSTFVIQSSFLTAKIGYATTIHVKLLKSNIFSPFAFSKVNYIWAKVLPNEEKNLTLYNFLHFLNPLSQIKFTLQIPSSTSQTQSIRKMRVGSLNPHDLFPFV